MTEINPEMNFRAVEGLELNRVPDGAMVYQSARERVHYLNPTALIVFELCGLEKSAGEIEIFLADAFGLETSPTGVARDCLASLLDEGLVVCTSSPAAA